MRGTGKEERKGERRLEMGGGRRGRERGGDRRRWRGGKKVEVEERGKKGRREGRRRE